MGHFRPSVQHLCMSQCEFYLAQNWPCIRVYSRIYLHGLILLHICRPINLEMSFLKSLTSGLMLTLHRIAKAHTQILRGLYLVSKYYLIVRGSKTECPNDFLKYTKPFYSQHCCPLISFRQYLTTIN